MAWGFRKSIKIAPGVRINLSKSGVSTSVGGKGLTWNSRGRATASLPGTGLRYTATNRAGTRSSVGSAKPAVGKRAAANAEFVATMGDRVAGALHSYFTSHGICVGPQDYEHVIDRPEHQGLFNEMEPHFQTVITTAKLYNDTDSLLAPQKNTAMLAIYAIEAGLSAHAGRVLGLEEALDEFQNAHSKTYAPPALPTLSFLVVCGVAAFIPPHVFWLIPAGIYGYFYVRREQATKLALSSIDAERNSSDRAVSQLVVEEVTPRTAL